MPTSVSLTELPSLVGKDLGYTEYRSVTQDDINTFAKAADDDQWIHTDPERAKSGPFGTTIAHGFLTLALTIPLWSELLDVTGVTTKVNYGLDKVRFPAPVPVGARIRLRGSIAELTDIPGGVQVTMDQVIEVEGSDKPSVVARAVHRYYV